MGQDTLASYGPNYDPWQIGQLFDITDSVVDSYAAEAAVEFGTGLCKGATDNTAKNVTTNAQVFVGVALRTLAKEKLRTGGVAYAIGDTISVLRRGRVVVQVSEAVTKGQAAYCDVSSTDIGKFNPTASVNLAVPNGTFLFAAAAGALTVLDIG